MRPLLRPTPFLFCLTGLLMVLALPARAQHPCSTNGIAVGGYDLVSYYSDDGPVMGSQQLTAYHEGLVYQFSSEANLRQFSSEPSRYLPRYSGFCATTLAMGRLLCPDYNNFKIEDGDLLLFEMTGFTNGRTVWNSDPLGFRVRADAFAKKLLGP
ncbi:MAG: YHS domain-containing (seleno)protein [Pseudomonadota bacterium]